MIQITTIGSTIEIIDKGSSKSSEKDIRYIRDGGTAKPYLRLLLLSVPWSKIYFDKRIVLSTPDFFQIFCP